MKILYVIVLYKCNLDESNTCKSIIKSNMNDINAKFLIWDNSPNSNITENIVNHFFGCECEFIRDENNCALSKVYNYALCKYGDFDLIQFFDQDSTFHWENYNKYLSNELLGLNCNLFLPKIYSNNLLYSPGKMFVFKGVHYKNIKEGFNQSKYFTAITSGILIKPRFFCDNKLYFNEKLVLYGIDTDFIEKYKKICKKFFLIPFSIDHDLSETHLDKYEKKKRRRVMISALYVIYEKNFYKKFIVSLYYLILKICKKV